jgi:hypothetical protein
MNQDGRYEGSGGGLSVVLRVDAGGSGIISADLFQGSDYLTSTRTRPGPRVDSANGTWAAEFSAEQAPTGSGTVPGTISLAPVDEMAGALRLTVQPDLDVAGLAAGRKAEFTVARRSAELRELGLETETEQGVEVPRPVDFDGAGIDEQECFRRAGFAVSVVGAATAIPRQAEPWDRSRLFTLLHDTMTASARANLSSAAWRLHLLLLSSCSQTGLAGIMFDAAGLLPRQGCAVFLDTVRRYAAQHEEDPDRNAIRTIVHELGHALNLAHRFEEGVGRADSTSFMNYPYRFVPGGADAYWAAFRFAFDSDELDFLRHAPLGAVMPGTAGFHSVAYWTGHGWLPPASPAPASVLVLGLKLPPAGPTFVLGQPVFLEVVLENVGDTPVTFASEPLDLKAGPLRVFVRPRPHEESDRVEFRVFVPLAMGCVEPDEPVTLAAHDLLSNNVNIGFGARGSTFDSAGIYQVVALLDLQPPWGRVVGRMLEIRVVDEMNADAGTLLRRDVGAWFALGGSDALAEAATVLEDLRLEREIRNGPADPIVAAIVRAAGINAGREVTRYQDGEFRARPGDPVRAEALLASLDDAALGNFDPYTAADTARLAAHYAAMNRGDMA